MLKFLFASTIAAAAVIITACTSCYPRQPAIQQTLHCCDQQQHQHQPTEQMPHQTGPQNVPGMVFQRQTAVPIPSYSFSYVPIHTVLVLPELAILDSAIPRVRVQQQGQRQAGGPFTARGQKVHCEAGGTLTVIDIDETGWYMVFYVAPETAETINQVPCWIDARYFEQLLDQSQLRPLVDAVQALDRSLSAEQRGTSEFVEVLTDTKDAMMQMQSAMQQMTTQMGAAMDKSAEATRSTNTELQGVRDTLSNIRAILERRRPSTP